MFITGKVFDPTLDCVSLSTSNQDEMLETDLSGLLDSSGEIEVVAF
jgi:hypothetical protein